MKLLFRLLIALVLSTVFLPACKKENAPTQGQLIAARLKNDLSMTQIESVSIYVNSNGSRDSGTRVTVNDDGTITILSGNIQSATYSLANLLSYQIQGVNLYLYF